MEHLIGNGFYRRSENGLAAKPLRFSKPLRFLSEFIYLNKYRFLIFQSAPGIEHFLRMNLGFIFTHF